jgi:hypothetical protein
VFSGALGIPCVGEFKNGRGDFYDQDNRDLSTRCFFRVLPFAFIRICAKFRGRE